MGRKKRRRAMPRTLRQRKDQKTKKMTYARWVGYFMNPTQKVWIRQLKAIRKIRKRYSRKLSREARESGHITRFLNHYYQIQSQKIFKYLCSKSLTPAQVYMGFRFVFYADQSLPFILFRIGFFPTIRIAILALRRGEVSVNGAPMTLLTYFL